MLAMSCRSIARVWQAAGKGEIREKRDGPFRSVGETWFATSLPAQNFLGSARDNRRTKSSCDSKHFPLVPQGIARLAKAGGKDRAVRDTVQALRGMVVHHKRTTAPASWAGNRRRNAVKVLVGNFKNHRPVEQRFHCGLAPASIVVPQFELSAVLMLPGFVEVCDERKAPGQASFVSHITVGMNVKLAAGRHHMISTALQVWIRQQLPYSGDLRKEV